MSYGYLGDTSTKIKQKVKNQGVISSSDALDLQSKGHLGGSLELITSSSVTSMTSAVDMTTCFTSKYDVYLLKARNVKSNQNAYTVGIQFYESGTLESGTVYDYGLQGGRTNNADFYGVSSNEAWIHIGADTDDDAENSSNSYTYIYSPTDSSRYTYLTTQSTGQYDAVTNYRFGGGCLPQTSTVDGLRLRSTHGSGQITGEFALYGVKEL
tara:strand:- start:2975 stop:3607 length:633 start_codon:yes stop_codon:yes gene_type:complete